jgi:hypothetical protein
MSAWDAPDADGAVTVMEGAATTGGGVRAARVASWLFADASFWEAPEEGVSGPSNADCVSLEGPDAKTKPPKMAQTAMIRMYQSRSLARIAGRIGTASVRCATEHGPAAVMTDSRVAGLLVQARALRACLAQITLAHSRGGVCAELTTCSVS